LGVGVPFETRLEARREAIRDCGAPFCPRHIDVDIAKAESPLIV
jgi:hypothetical protein